MASSGTHLSRRQGSEVDVRPFLFHGLAVSSPNTSRIIERIVCLAGRAMAGKVEFRDIVGEFKVLNIKIRMVLGETFEMMD